MRSQNPENSQTPFPKEMSSPPSEEKEKKTFLDVLKKVGFSLWLTVMVIGGVLAFITSLLLL